MRPTQTKTLTSSKVVMVDNKHLSLIIALIILCCVGFLVTYYKVDSDYANQAGDFNRVEQRLSDLAAKVDAINAKLLSTNPVK